jgi:hypothetical protein
MPENRIEEIVRNAVAQSLERQLAALRESVVQDVLREVAPALAEKQKDRNTGAENDKGAAETPGASATLQRAVSAIQAGANQKEILRALLDNSSLYSGRAALFIIKAGTASGWQGTGFSGSEPIKDFVPNISRGLGAKVMQSRSAEAGQISEFDQQFAAKFGSPAEGKIVLLPLLLKDKISALVYADAGTDAETDATALDVPALDVLVRATSAWLEVTSQRKQAQKDGTPEAEMNSATAVTDPFAAHSPVHGKTEQAAESAPVAAMSAAAAWGAPASSPAAAPSPAPAAPHASPAITDADADVHRKAQRFARLLIDEIKLYNQAKVTEGRKHKDLYDRLKEDIDKSRTTYQKRYGSSAASNADYFTQELIRNVAEGDVSLLGPSFRR